LEVFRNLPLRWFMTGMIFYFLTCLQCAFQTTLTFQAVIHFTDWVVGHAHMVMFGVFGFWQLGTMTYLIPRLLGKPWASARLLEAHYWLSVIGLTVMVSALIPVGVFQGHSWAALQYWGDSIQVSLPAWYTRLASGLLIIAGQICFVVNIVMTAMAARPAGAGAGVEDRQHV
jgi:cytochrome c oxidase cbb3-type subunit 1